MIAVSRHTSWDAIHPDSLLNLAGVRRVTHEFGFLLRHYWMPGTELTYERVTESTRARIVRRPGKCNADAIWWRETVQDSSDDSVRSVCFCIYDRSAQTFRTQGILDETIEPESIEDARIQAFWNQPILTPLLPIPLGFQWHVSAENGYMDFLLESETTVGDMPVLFVRRYGRFTLDGSGPVEREGITAYALDRSVVLEDRTRDRLVDTGQEAQLTITKLTKSVLLPQDEEE